MRKRWSLTDVATLRAAIADGKSSRQCSQLLDGRFSSVSCLDKARSEGLRFSGRPGRRGEKPSGGFVLRRMTTQAPAAKLPVFPETVEFIGPRDNIPDDRRTCRAIAGHPAVESWQYCGHPVMSPKISYCAVHAERFYNKAYLERLR